MSKIIFSVKFFALTIISIFLAASAYSQSTLNSDCPSVRADIRAAEIQTTADLHATLNRQLNFPEYYGHNLDALYDTLSTDICAAEIWIWGAEEIAARFGTAWDTGFLPVFEDAARENQKLHIFFMSVDGVTLIRRLN